MGNYTKPPINSIPFRFTTGGYSKPNFGNIPFNFKTRPSYTQTGDMKATISVFGIYQETTYTRLKYCQNYVVGYNKFGVQILKGKCFYEGIRDLGGRIVGAESWFITDEKDLSAWIKGTLRGPPQNISAYLKIFQRDEKDLSTVIRGLTWDDLPSVIYPIPPKDLNAFLKVWPQRFLPANIHGWQEIDLASSICIYQKYDLSAIIGVEGPKNLYARIKGWGREVIADLPAFIRGMVYEGLGAQIRAKYIGDLPSYIGTIQPANLPSFIHSWQEFDLSASLNGVYGDYDLRANINATGNFYDLPARIKAAIDTEFEYDLRASLFGWIQKDLNAFISAVSAPDLGATIVAKGGSGNLLATIYPKVVRLTGVISVSTMEHKNIYAVINAVCGASAHRNLYAYIRAVFKSDLNAVIIGKRVYEVYSNLNARIGFTDQYLVVDTLPLNITISSDFYKVVDKLPLYFQNFNKYVGLNASITGILTDSNLGASITADYLDPYSFDSPKYKEIVRKLTYNQIQESFEVVEFSFKSIVNDMFFFSGAQKVYKMDKLDKWILEARSFIPQDTRLNIKRKLHRVKNIYDLTDFNNIDEAMKFAINYVTEYPVTNLSAYIKATGGFTDMTSYIFTKQTDNNNLGAQISCV
jgi:hypothetical protein